jgi:hypothetical protein
LMRELIWRGVTPQSFKKVRREVGTQPECVRTIE